MRDDEENNWIIFVSRRLYRWETRVVFDSPNDLSLKALFYDRLVAALKDPQMQRWSILFKTNLSSLYLFN